MKYLLVLIIGGLLIQPLYSQNLKDTLQLNQVTVTAAKTYTQEIGGRSSNISEEILEENKTKSLAELISDNSVANIKSMGQGALSTISFRGTSSTHTQVIWNGISLNSPQLGNFDFSQIPIFFVDNVKLYHGTGSFRNQTGALGGSVNFNNNSEKAPRYEIKLLAEYGSNKTFTEGLGLKKSFGDLTLSTRLYHQSSKNDYRYLNKVLTNIPFYERRAHADYKQSGVMQEAYYDLKTKGQLAAIVWWQYNDRNLPPPIFNQTKPNEHQSDHNLRTSLSYSNKKNKSSYRISTAYLTDRSYYTRRFDIALGDTAYKNKSGSWTVNGEYSYKFNSKFQLGSAINYRFDKVISDNFLNKEARRNIFSGRIFWQYNPLYRLQTEGQIMTETNSGKSAFTYNLGARYHLISELLSIKASHAYNYRFPSLNDLFWEPGGNKDLKPERGFSTDITLSLTPTIHDIKFGLDATFYNMNIKDWIMWIPVNNGYIWEPANFTKVLSQGFEIQGKANFNINKTKHDIIFNYGYTSSKDRSSRDDKTRNKQLPYIPLNKWNGRYSFAYRQFAFTYNINFTDIRYTSADESYFTNAYTIHNVQMQYLLKYKSDKKLKCSLRIDNLFNSYYESTQYYPMPLRSFSLQLSTTF